MTDYHIHPTRPPSPHDVLTRCIEIAPGFGAAWQKSFFVEDDGSFNIHGVLAEFSHYVREHLGVFDEAMRKELFSYIEQCVTWDAHIDSEISNAACTCFLENLAGEGKFFSDLISQYLGPQSKKHFREWDH